MDTKLKKGEVILIAFAVFSKKSVCHRWLFSGSKELHAIGFTGNSLNWLLGYLTSRKQFVQVNDQQSNLVDAALY